MKNASVVKQTNREKVLLVVLDLKNKDWPVSEVLHEMKELVVASGGVVESSVICRVDKFSARNLIGDGKLVNIANLCNDKNVDTVIYT